jgi:membrane-bound lytic murein transglycosylase A
MDRIRQWMLADPDGGRELRRMNKSYVFFRITGLSDHEEAVGAQGVQLTPGRSIAVDRHLHLYGTLFWIEAELPIAGETPDTKFRRLMVAQDTGSAIIGPARADIYFGAGEELGRIAGRIKQQGRFVMLVPLALDPARDAGDVPLPLRRPSEAGPPLLMAAAAPVSAPVPATARNAPPPQTARPIPVPQPRPQVPEPPRMAEPVLPPGWLPSVASPQSAEDSLRSVASAESAIISAASAPLAFAAPEKSQATASILRQSARIGPVPLPRARPQGPTPVRQ